VVKAVDGRFSLFFQVAGPDLKIEGKEGAATDIVVDAHLATVNS
jgi:hypothetical protein